MRGADRLMAELKGMNCSRSGSKPHSGDSHKEHRAEGGSMYGRSREDRREEMHERMERRPERMERRERMEDSRMARPPMQRMERRERREMESSERPSRPMRRYATGGNVKAMEMKAEGGEMSKISNVVKGRKLNAVGPKETWNMKKEGGNVDREERSGGGIMGLMNNFKAYTQKQKENRQELQRFRDARNNPNPTVQQLPLKKGGRAHRNRGGQMLGGAAMNSQSPATMYSHGGKAKDEHREHHWMGAALGMALPILANLAGGALGGYFGGNKAEGGSIKRRKGGCIKRAMGGSGKERKDEY